MFVRDFAWKSKNSSTVNDPCRHWLYLIALLSHFIAGAFSHQEAALTHSNRYLRWSEVLFLSVQDDSYATPSRPILNTSSGKIETARSP
jgi:hypothetical protein